MRPRPSSAGFHAAISTRIGADASTSNGAQPPRSAPFLAGFSASARIGSRRQSAAWSTPAARQSPACGMSA